MTPRKKSPGLAVLLSLIPGLGHVYAGEGGKGLLLFLATALAGFLMIIVPGVQFAFSSIAGGIPSAGYNPLVGDMTVAVTAPLYIFVVGPALVIYSAASSHRSIVQQNAATGAAKGAALAGGVPEAGTVTFAGNGSVGAPAGGPPAASWGTGYAGEWTIPTGQAAFWGVVLTTLGVVLVLPPLFPGLSVSAGRLWPLLLVVLGAAVIWGAAGDGRFGRGKE